MTCITNFFDFSNNFVQKVDHVNNSIFSIAKTLFKSHNELHKYKLARKRLLKLTTIWMEKKKGEEKNE